eukprot:765463-Hanusia_phi.AAC.1
MAISASEARLAMACGLHGRLGEESCVQLLGCGDILVEILRFVPIIVPDHVETLKEAVEVALPNQLIVLRRGEYIVGSNPGQSVIAGKQESGNTILQLMRDVSLCGEAGTVLKGMLVIPRQVSCSMSNITITDAGQCCVKVESGKMYLDNCSLICGHASAVRIEGDGEVAAKRCRLGGEGEIGKAVPEFYELPRTWIDTAGSVQEYGLRKNSCERNASPGNGLRSVCSQAMASSFATGPERSCGAARFRIARSRGSFSGMRAASQSTGERRHV